MQEPGRQLKCEENKKLRTAYLDIVEKNSDFGLKMSDLVKSLPALTIGPAASIPFLTFFQKTNGQPAPITWWIIPAALSAIGFLITIFAAKITSRRELKEYIRMAYEKNQYYLNCLNDATEMLKILYEEIDTVHENIFGIRHPTGQNQNSNSLVRKITDRARISYCRYIDNHFRFLLP